jgi:hypothetical protein
MIGAVGFRFFLVGAAAQDRAPARSVDSLSIERHEGQGDRAINKEIQVRSWVSQTALWVGDRVTFTIEIDCAPNVDVIPADLAKDRLKVEGLEILDARTGRRDRDRGVGYTFEYDLTAYDVETATPRVADLTVRYFVRRAGQRVEDTTPAGEVRIPGAALALRSTLPDDLRALDARDQRPAGELPAFLTFARPVGIGLLVLSAAPVGLWVASLVRRGRTRHTRARQRDARQHARTALEALKVVDLATEMGRRQAYAQMDVLLRRHAEVVARVPAASLTPAEIRARLDANGASLPVDPFVALLDECERVRFGPPRELPPPQRVREAIERVEALLEGQPHPSWT